MKIIKKKRRPKALDGKKFKNFLALHGGFLFKYIF